jgi:phosphopantothenoylcysteine decarboxylase
VNILLGLTGSVATTLHDKLITELSKLGNVKVIITEHASCFLDGIDPLTSWTDNCEWQWEGEGWVRCNYEKDDPILHIDLTTWADVFVIAPCTANTVGKITHGICDNLLTSCVMAWGKYKRMVIAPAMNTRMWENRTLERNLKIIKDTLPNVTLVNPVSKVLACGEEGVGAMANITDIVAAVTARTKWCTPTRILTLNAIPINPHPGAFGYKRKNERHTGIDLYCKENHDSVYSVEDGVVVGIEKFTGAHDASPWWEDTWCILIEGPSGVVCYGEIQDPSSNFDVGYTVKQGEYLGCITRVIKKGREHPEITGWMPQMLHLELYPHGTTKASEGFSDKLIDPTPYILDAYRDFLKLVVTYDKYKPTDK